MPRRVTICAHGKVRCWHLTDIRPRGEPLAVSLPEIEYCPVCDADTTPLHPCLEQGED